MKTPQSSSQEKVFLTSVRPSPVKISSNHNQFLSYSKVHANTSKQSLQSVSIPDRKQPLNIDLERSGSDYVKHTSIPEELRRINSTNKITMKSADFGTISEQLAKLTKKSHSPQVNAQPQSSYLERNQQLAKFRKSHSQTKPNQFQTEPSQSQKVSPERYYKVETPKATGLSSNQISRPSSGSKLEQKKNNIRRKAQTPQQMHDSVNVQLSMQSYQQQLNNNSTYSSKVPTPLTTRPTTTISQLASNAPSSTKNQNKSGESLKQFQFKQQLHQTLATFQNLKTTLDKNKLNKSKEYTTREERNSQSTQVNQNQEEPGLLIQFVTQVKMGQVMPTTQLSSNRTSDSKKKSKVIDPKIQTKKLLENMRQIGKVVYGTKQDTKCQSAPQIKYYMARMSAYQKEETEPNAFVQLYRDHFVQSFHALGFCSVLNPPPREVLLQKRVNLSRRRTLFDKTVVLDLDETLIHCNENSSIPSDVNLPIEFPNGEIIHAGVNVRPYAVQLLTQLTSLCEVIIFTASHQCYASKVLDYLDPTGRLIHHRLFRDSCVTTEEGVHIKDLSIINRDLKDMVLVDNAAYSFGFQLDNGIPIIPYYDNKNDIELVELLDYLKMLLQVPDVRPVNREHFKMHMYGQCDTIEEALAQILD